MDAFCAICGDAITTDDKVKPHEGGSIVTGELDSQWRHVLPVGVLIKQWDHRAKLKLDTETHGGGAVS